jgi:ATP/maltotriose-dependent transcriptional regulator MalT
MADTPNGAQLAGPLLRTKLHVPPIRRELVSRAPLIERLDQGFRLGARLTLISSPAGFGKTTLLSEWIHREAGRTPFRSAAWLSLDERDNELDRFLVYVVAALQAAGIGCDVSPLQGQPLPASSAFPGAWVRAQSLLTALINEVAAAPGPIVLVLDDYHLMTAQPIHDAVTFLLDNLPDSMHLAMATRADPPLPIARLRARGQLIELRQTDLRFSPDKAAVFLNQTMGLSLSGVDVTALAARTEGWIAGLQMAALALQSLQRTAGPVAQFVQTFAGSNRYILDYLIEEVLQRQPEHIQAFLLQTAILERLSGALCDAVLDQEEGGQETLEYLERANLFVVPLDDRRTWYRYHRLFADLLLRRLQQVNRSRIATLHSRASAWYEQQGQMDEAIEHAFSGRSLDRAACLIEREAQDMLMHSRVSTLLDWIERLPDDRVRASSSLCLYNAWALLLIGRSVDEIEAHLQALETSDLMASQVATMRAFLASVTGELSRAAAMSRQVLDQLPAEDTFLRSLASWILAFSDLSGGSYAVGIHKLEQIARQSQETGNVMVAASALTMIARTRVRQGRLAEAKAVFERAIAAGTDRYGHPLPVAGRAMISLGNLLREWNDGEAAEQALLQGIALTERWREIATLPGYIALARLRQAQGDAGGANEAIQHARRIAVAFDAAEWDDELVEMYQARLWIAQGHLEAAAQWAGEREFNVDVPLSAESDGEDLLLLHLRRYEHPMRARLLVHQGFPDKALDLLASTAPDETQQGNLYRRIEIHILRALALDARGDASLALDDLARALSLAQPGGYVRIFVDEGTRMRDLLRLALSRGMAVDYVGMLLSAFEQEGSDEANAAQHPNLARVREPASAIRPVVLFEPLTDRELEILRLVAAGLPNRAISDTLIIAIGTVKKHLKNIYDKLDVHSRTQAVARAQDLHLL